MSARALPVLAALVALLALPGPGRAQESAAGAATETNAHQILTGEQRGAAEHAREVVRNPAQLRNLLAKIFSGQAPPQAPEIDFTQQVLVFYSVGRALNNGERVYIRSGTLDHGVLHVNVEIAKPGEDCLQTQSLTAPYALAALPFPAADVRRAEYSVSHKSYPCR